MLIVGIAQYDKNAPAVISEGDIDELPDTEDLPQDKKTIARYLAYVFGWVVLLCGGSFVQLKYIASDDCDEDDMMNKDFS